MKKNVETMFGVIRALYDHKVKKIRRRTLVSLSLQTYAKRIYESAMVSLKHYTGLRLARKEVYRRTSEFYNQRRQVQVLHFFKTHLEIKQENRMKE